MRSTVGPISFCECNSNCCVDDVLHVCESLTVVTFPVILLLSAYRTSLKPGHIISRSPLKTVQTLFPEFYTVSDFQKDQSTESVVVFVIRLLLIKVMFISYSVGVLVLNVTKDLYQELGLEGQVSRFHSKTKMKYVIRIDLTLPHFKPGGKHFERVKWCMNERLDLKFDFLVAWLPQGNFSHLVTCLSIYPIYGIYIAPLQGNYSEARPGKNKCFKELVKRAGQILLKRADFRWETVPSRGTHN